MESASTLREMVTKLDINECKKLRRWLKGRMRILKKRSIIEMPVEELPLSDKARLILKQENIKMVKDIINIGINGLYIMRGVGPVTLKEIQQCVEQHLPNAFTGSMPPMPSDIQWRG